MPSICSKCLCICGLGLALVMAGCGSSSSSSSSASSGASASSTTSSSSGPLSVGLVLPCPTNDLSWCQQGYQAAQTLQQQGLIKFHYLANAPQDTASASQIMERYAKAGDKLVIGHSSWQDAAFAAGKAIPGTDFAYGGGGQTATNVATYNEPIYQAGYLAGIIAAGISKKGKIGGIAGPDVPLCHAELAAFDAGAKSVDPSIQTTNTYDGDWNDITKGKQATLAQASQGADVFLACGGGPASGMVQAIKQENLSGFGYVADMSSLAPKNVVGSIIYNLVPYFTAMVHDVDSGTYRPGKAYTFGLAQNGVYLKLNPSYAVTKIPASSTAAMQKALAAVKAGKLTVPNIGS